MKLSESRKRANDKYLSEQEEIKIRVPKGKKDKIKDQAESQGMSVNAYIIGLIEKDMEKSPRQ